MLKIQPYIFLVDESKSVKEKYFVKKELNLAENVRKGTIKEYMKKYIKKEYPPHFLIETANGIYVQDKFFNLNVPSRKGPIYKKLEDGENVEIPMFQIEEMEKVTPLSYEKYLLEQKLLISNSGRTFPLVLKYNLKQNLWTLRTSYIQNEGICPLCKLEACGSTKNFITSCTYIDNQQIKMEIIKYILQNEKVMSKWENEENPYRIKMALAGAFSKPKIW